MRILGIDGAAYFLLDSTIPLGIYQAFDLI